MHGFTTVDGFVEVNECVMEMIKYLANEPSLGLFFVQEHTHKAVPNLINLKDKAVETSKQTVLQTEDLEDSTNMVRSMKECGPSIIDEMVNDIRKSLHIMSISKPTKGLLHKPVHRFQLGRSSSWGPVAFNNNSTYSQLDDASSESYFSTVLKSAKQKANAFRWSQLDNAQHPNASNEKPLPYLTSLPGSNSPLSPNCPINEIREVPLPNQVVEFPSQEQNIISEILPAEDLSAMLETYDLFKSHKESKLQEWLQDSHE